MRRIISALAALCLAVTALFPAFAETAQAAEKKVINWMKPARSGSQMPVLPVSSKLSGPPVSA